MKLKKITSLLVAAALTSAIFVGCGNADKKTEAALKDGTYTAELEADERGYVASIEIEVKDGKIASVKYDEGKDGESKLDNEEYNTKMKDKSGSSPKEAYPALEAALIEKQDVQAVDTVTGATSTSDSFRTLAEKALESAK
ncbi:MAG: FMN-binding protein [Clostridiales bacterium]|nr:FMN-binding protein [Clostridiales bacterium]